MNDTITRAINTSLEDALQQLADDGFVVLDVMCDANLVKHLLDVSISHSREIMAALGKQTIGIGSAAGFDEVVQRSPGRWDIPISPVEFGVDDRSLPWWSLIAMTLGADAEHSFSGVVCSDPGSPAQFWHIDSPHIAAQHLPPHALNVMVALHDTPLSMGPTEFARGSHRLTNHLRNPSLISDKLVYQHETTGLDLLVADTGDDIPQRVSSKLTAGSCLVFDDRILHRGLANDSTSQRRMAYFAYRRSGYFENTHFESQRSVYGAIA